MASVTYDHASRIYSAGSRPAINQLDLAIDDGEFLVLVALRVWQVNCTPDAGRFGRR